MKKRVAARGKKVKRRVDDHATEGAEEKKVGKSVVERCILTPIPNHLSTHLTPLLQNKTTPHIFKTTKPLHHRSGEHTTPSTLLLLLIF